MHYETVFTKRSEFRLAWALSAYHARAGAKLSGYTEADNGITYLHLAPEIDNNDVTRVLSQHGGHEQAIRAAPAKSPRASVPAR